MEEAWKWSEKDLKWSGKYLCVDRKVCRISREAGWFGRWCETVCEVEYEVEDGVGVGGGGKVKGEEVDFWNSRWDLEGQAALMMWECSFGWRRLGNEVRKIWNEVGNITVWGERLKVEEKGCFVWRWIRDYVRAWIWGGRWRWCWGWGQAERWGSGFVRIVGEMWKGKRL